MEDRRIDRRSFIKLSGLLGLGVASAGIIPITAEAVKFNRKKSFPIRVKSAATVSFK